MKKLLVLCLMAAAFGSAGSVRAQIAIPMGPATAVAGTYTGASAAAITGGAYAGKKAVGACVRHPILCAATVAVGAGYHLAMTRCGW